MGIIDKAKEEIERLGKEALGVVEGQLAHPTVAKLLADLVALVEGLMSGGESELEKVERELTPPERPPLPAASTMPVPIVPKAPIE